MKKTLNAIWTILSMPFRAIILLTIAPFAIAKAMADDMQYEYAQALDSGFTDNYKDFCARYDEWQRVKQHI